MAKSNKPTPHAPKHKPKPAAKSKPAAKGKPSPPAKKPAPKPAPKPVAKSGKVEAKPGAAKVEAKAGSPAPAGGAGAKVPPKGITIVSNKPVRKPKPKKLEMPVTEPLFKPGNKWKPLIPSGPKAPPSSGIPGVAVHKEFKADPKAKLSKKELEHYRAILLKKRAEVLGDMNHMEDEALRSSSSGSLSNMPQHMADQGSDTFDQSMSLSLVDVDRGLIREIDEALKRIEEGTYGVCLRTGRRIPAERLEQVPWTKYTIEAARELERKPIYVRENPYPDRSSSSANANL